MKQYISYYRVSTTKQGRSGLGLSAQQSSVLDFIKDDDVLLNQYTEVESGTLNNRPILSKALEECRETGATFLIA